VKSVQSVAEIPCFLFGDKSGWFKYKKEHESFVIEVMPEIRPTEAAPNAELLRSLGRLVRGLSALFWGLPVALVLCVQAVQTDLFQHFAYIPAGIANIIPPVIATGWLLFGLFQLGYFQRQERIWINALDRAKLLALVNFGLSPFLYWWNQQPHLRFFTVAVQVLAVTGLMFLDSLNLVLYRLSVMLPDESLRQETRHFTLLNRMLVTGILCGGILFAVYLHFPDFFIRLIPDLGNYPILASAGLWVFIFLVLLPLAVTMALIWKIKQTILDSVFGG
jgi:hypothetical protein